MVFGRHLGEISSSSWGKETTASSPRNAMFSKLDLPIYQLLEVIYAKIMCQQVFQLPSVISTANQLSPTFNGSHRKYS